MVSGGDLCEAEATTEAGDEKLLPPLLFIFIFFISAKYTASVHYNESGYKIVSFSAGAKSRSTL